jgi:hypothetical protein
MMMLVQEAIRADRAYLAVQAGMLQTANSDVVGAVVTRVARLPVTGHMPRSGKSG